MNIPLRIGIFDDQSDPAVSAAALSTVSLEKIPNKPTNSPSMERNIYSVLIVPLFI